ncbi:hypothetical protein Q5O24_06590 [Eubacteriaceae bacterium ES3]|nr:hypothetical protein Q5O24_06590 [Eubacteriaceae bacterium ES3]
MDQKKKQWIRIFLVIAVGILLLVLMMFIFRSCEAKRIQEAIENYESDTYYLDPEVGYAEIVDLIEAPSRDINTGEIATEGCQPQMQLYIKAFTPTEDEEADTVNFTLTTKPYVLPSELTVNPPSNGIQVLTPVEDQKLTAGSDFLLKWSIDTRREVSVDVLFSSDGGATYMDLATGIANQDETTVTIPDTESQNCLFRINVWVGTALLGYNQSDIFSVVTPATESSEENNANNQTEATTETQPEENVEPEQDASASENQNNITPEIDPNLYTTNDGEMISLTGDTVRSFWLDHDFNNVDHIVWQLSTVKSSCDEEQISDIGLIATGTLPGKAISFNLDFASILGSYGNNQEVENHGSDFTLAPEIFLPVQSQRAVYLRVLLYDQDNQLIEASGSGFELIVGQPSIDLNSEVPTSDLPSPILSAKTEPGFEPGSFEEFPENGLYLFNDGAFDRTLMLSDIPGESVEIDLQIASQPFNNQTMTDFTQPAGLVYRDQKTGITYTTVTKFYELSFSEIIPKLNILGNGTIRYYLRAVCYVPGETPGTMVPLATKESSIVFTGDYAIYLAGSFDINDQPPEEVTVHSYVPSTEFLRYIPTRWAIDNADEYFEVTRPIEAEEICFYIKNNKTGDFLYPYEMHMYLYPNTTRAEYQAIVDRMLPVGAWFHLSITQSGWDAFWSDFFDLLSQIYEGVSKAYADLKVTVANTVADRFAFLGEEMQSYIKTAVTGLIDYGLVSVGLPPSLPNFDELADQGLDYCVRVALEETARSMDIPVEQIPADVRNAIAEEVSSELDRLTEMKTVNPFNVSYLKPATEAQYQPAFVDVELHNQHAQRSPSGTLMISYYPPGKPHFKIYDTMTLSIPSLGPGESTFIRVYLSPGNTELPIYKEYYNGNTGECELVIRAQYDVVDLETAAAEQQVTGTNSLHPDVYVYDIEPVYEYRVLNTPADELFK